MAKQSIVKGRATAIAAVSAQHDPHLLPFGLQASCGDQKEVGRVDEEVQGLGSKDSG